jgi:hypothetical protein
MRTDRQTDRHGEENKRKSADVRFECATNKQPKEGKKAGRRESKKLKRKNMNKDEKQQ